MKLKQLAVLIGLKILHQVARVSKINQLSEHNPSSAIDFGSYSLVFGLDLTIVQLGSLSCFLSF